MKVFWDKPSKSFILWPYFWNVELYKMLEKISDKKIIIDKLLEREYKKLSSGDSKTK